MWGLVGECFRAYSNCTTAFQKYLKQKKQNISIISSVNIHARAPHVLIISGSRPQFPEYVSGENQERV